MLQYWRVLALAVALLAVGAFQLYGLFSNEGYAPKQPINYSHVLHAGVMKMECLYCHFTAEQSAHAGIPAVDVCMGCHSIVKTDSPEIQKLTEYYNNNEPVPWVRIHKLPDHAYFSHKWHVRAGVSCQTCHGPVENMPVVGQWTKLEMGACMECHRQDTYVSQVNHTPTWHGPTLTDEQLEDAKREMYAMEQANGDGGLEVASTAGAGTAGAVRDGEWASVDIEFNKYHSDEAGTAKGLALRKMLEEYKSDLYQHGWHYQIRGKNASVECTTCHY